MALLSQTLGQCQTGQFHWCEPCDQVHILPSGRGWTWNGDVEKPTYSPSFKHSWHEGPERVAKVCHYVLTDGILAYCGDCTHGMAGQSFPLPPLDAKYKDFW